MSKYYRVTRIKSLDTMEVEHMKGNGEWSTDIREAWKFTRKSDAEWCIKALKHRTFRVAIETNKNVPYIVKEGK